MDSFFSPPPLSLHSYIPRSNSVSTFSPIPRWNSMSSPSKTPSQHLIPSKYISSVMEVWPKFGGQNGCWSVDLRWLTIGYVMVQIPPTLSRLVVIQHPKCFCPKLNSVKRLRWNGGKPAATATQKESGRNKKAPWASWEKGKRSRRQTSGRIQWRLWHADSRCRSDAVADLKQKKNFLLNQIGRKNWRLCLHLREEILHNQGCEGGEDEMLSSQEFKRTRRRTPRTPSHGRGLKAVDTIFN